MYKTLSSVKNQPFLLFKLEANRFGCFFLLGMIMMIGLSMKSFVLIAITAAAISTAVIAGPLHAQCTINW